MKRGRGMTNMYKKCPYLLEIQGQYYDHIACKISAK